MAGLIRFDPTRGDPFNEPGELSDRLDRVFRRLPVRRHHGQEELNA